MNVSELNKIKALTLINSQWTLSELCLDDTINEDQSW